MLPDISRVTADCSSTAAAMVEDTSLSVRIVPWMTPIASTASRVADWVAAIWLRIWSVARPVCSARVFTSVATTAKPVPASPARAASMVALSASRLVCAAMPEMRPTTSPICVACSLRPATMSPVRCACSTASTGDPRRVAHLLADLVHRDGELLRARRRRTGCRPRPGRPWRPPRRSAG